MDVVDRSFQEEQRLIAASIAQSRNYTSAYRPKGVCHWCEEQVGESQLYCDHSCAQEHAKHEKLRGRST